MYLEDDSRHQLEAKDSFVRSGLTKTADLLVFGDFIALEEEMQKRPPDILILDNDLSSIQENGSTRGVDLILKYRKALPDTVIAQRTSFMSDRDTKRALAEGALEIFSKNDSLSDIVKYCFIFMKERNPS